MNILKSLQFDVIANRIRVLLEIEGKTEGFQAHAEPFKVAGKKMGMLSVYADEPFRLGHGAGPTVLPPKQLRKPFEGPEVTVTILKIVQYNPNDCPKFEDHFEKLPEKPSSTFFGRPFDAPTPGRAFRSERGADGNP